MLWDTDTGEPVANENSPYGLCVGVSPDGASVAESCSDRRVRFRNVKTLAVEREFRVHDSKVRAVEFPPKLQILATLGVTEARLWDQNDGQMLEEIRSKSEARRMNFVADGGLLQIDGKLFELKSCAP